MKKNGLKTWEIALLTALFVTAGVGLWAGHTQKALSSELIRLHVVARSDSAADQAEKLAVRDEVLALLAPLMRECGSRDEAIRAIESHKSELEALGDVTVSLGTEYYPTRSYETFSLPAGRYLSLRVVLGEGQGRNWWCVVYPALCTELLAEDTEDAFVTLDGETTAIITQADESYELKFRVVEWWGQLCEFFKRGA